MRRKMMKMKIIASAEGIIYRVPQKTWNLIDILIIVFVVQDVFSCVPLYYTNIINSSLSWDFQTVICILNS